MKSIFSRGIFSLFVGVLMALGDVSGREFFSIEKIRFHSKEPSNGISVYKEWLEPGPGGKQIKKKLFLPCLEVQVMVAENMSGREVRTKAYFYDAKKILLGKPVNISAFARENVQQAYPIPSLLEGKKKESIFFTVSEEVMAESNWTAVVVFGDSKSTTAKVFTKSNSSADSDWRKYDFPEKLNVGKDTQRLDRKAAMDPVVMEVVHTRNETQPQITLLMRPPKGITDGAEVKGVMAMCMLANSVDEIKNSLLKGAHPLMQFADKNKLAIIAWGSRRAWELKGSYYEFDQKQNRHVDLEFDKVAAAWERGIKSLSEKYGLPSTDYLLWASSGAANWAHRIALRRPQYFSAVHVEILSTHDRPTPEAKNIMWLLTTGELEGGYQSSLRFFKDCRELGYPMLYKAYPGVGHATCSQAQNLRREFFAFALERIEVKRGNQLGLLQQSRESDNQNRLEPFMNPLFYGDIVNQERFPSAEVEMIPSGFRTPLPTIKIAEAWDKQ